MHTKLLSSLGFMLLSALAAHNAQAAQAEDSLPQPVNTIVDKSIPAAQQQSMALAARRYYAFWNTGEAQYAQTALAANFIDRNLPAGRPQGPEGALFASKNFRAAVPDLKLQVEEMLLVGDRVIGRLHFTGHYSGSFHGQQGDGRKVDFIATDIYRIADGRIAENWHLEDNLTLLQQMGVVKN
ncbi:ester cyclase [Undibacterium pigrum]|uniref:Putative ester cyclase n=1 Tax=Undibacterium pigrum TaxID=401470 RepID=A0A318JBG9_9BURK|nr:ester cyclase [Undibacterium pigrum]PXX45438.1 putative ester cyclase [Undibacterium pigrum]